MEFKTLVIDTIDWAQTLLVRHVCASNGLTALGKRSDGKKDYGTSYNLLYEAWGQFLNQLTEVMNAGIHVVILAHANQRKIEQPEEHGAYDHWELALVGRTGAMTKQWADIVLFGNYKTIVMVDDNDGGRGKSAKASGGQRVMYADHSPWFDAKNRHELPYELSFEYSQIAHAIPDMQPTVVVQPDPVPVIPASQSGLTQAAEPQAAQLPTDNTAFHTALYDLMEKDSITAEEIQKAVAARGVYPEDTLIDVYDKDYVDGTLVAAWSQVVEFIKTNIRQGAK